MCYILGLEHPAYFESVPVSFITDESGGQIAVVSLDKDVDHTKVYVNPNNDDDDDKDEEEAAEKAKDNQTAAPLEVEDVEITDDGDDKSDSDVDKMDGDDDEVDGGDIDDSEDDDYNEDDDEDDEDDDDEDDDMDDSDYEFIPKSKEKLVVEKKSTDDDDDAVTGEGDDRGKQAVHRKRKPNIKEIAILDADNGLGNSIFDVHLCQSVIKPSCI